MVHRKVGNSDNDVGIRRGKLWWLPKWHIVIALLLTVCANIVAAIKLYDGATVCINTMDLVFHIDLQWMTYAETRLLTADIFMIILAIAVTIVEHLSYLRLLAVLDCTVYDDFKPNSCLRHFGGRIGCFVGILISYSAFIFWTLFLVGVLIITFFTATAQKMCEAKRGTCLDFTALDYIFPFKEEPYDEYTIICNPDTIDIFCQGGAAATSSLIYVIVCCFVVILCMTHFCRQLTYNYAILRSKEKFHDYHELMCRRQQFNPNSSMADILDVS